MRKKAILPGSRIPTSYAIRGPRVRSASWLELPIGDQGRRYREEGRRKTGKAGGSCLSSPFHPLPPFAGGRIRLYDTRRPAPAGGRTTCCGCFPSHCLCGLAGRRRRRRRDAPVLGARHAGDGADLRRPSVSPDGTLVVAFTVSVTDLEKNKRRQRHPPRRDRRLVGKAPDHPRGGRQPAALEPRRQDDLLRLDALGLGAGVEDRRRRRRGAAGHQAARSTWTRSRSRPDGDGLLFGMAVFPGKTPEADAGDPGRRRRSRRPPGCSSTTCSSATGTPGTTAPATTCSPTTSRPARRRDLMPAMDADCPTKPFGGSEDFAVSPDGKTVVFSAKDMGDGAVRGGVVHQLRPVRGPDRRLGGARAHHDEPGVGRAAEVLARRQDARLPGDEPARLRGGPLRDRAARPGRPAPSARSRCAPTNRRAATARRAASRGRRTARRSLPRRAPRARARCSRSTSPPARRGSWSGDGTLAATRSSPQAAGSSTA